MHHDVFPSNVHHMREATTHPALDEPSFLETIGFTKGDLMWSAALWLATASLAPFVIFYVLMVN